MKKKPNQKILCLMFILILMVPAACTMLKNKPSEQVLQERIEGMMQAKMDNDWATVYTYFDESYQKRESKEAFLNKPREMDYTAYTIESIEMHPSGKEATVKIKNDIQVREYDFKGTPATHHWIMEDGQWRLKVAVDEN